MHLTKPTSSARRSIQSILLYVFTLYWMYQVIIILIDHSIDQRLCVPLDAERSALPVYYDDDSWYFWVSDPVWLNHFNYLTRFLVHFARRP